MLTKAYEGFKESCVSIVWKNTIGLFGPKMLRNLKKLEETFIPRPMREEIIQQTQAGEALQGSKVLLWCFVISSNILKYYNVWLSWTVLWFKSYDVLWMCYGSLSEKHKPCRAIMPLHTQWVMTRPTWQNHAKSRFGFWQDDGREAALGLLGSFWHGPSASMTRIICRIIYINIR